MVVSSSVSISYYYYYFFYVTKTFLVQLISVGSLIDRVTLCRSQMNCLEAKVDHSNSSRGFFLFLHCGSGNVHCPRRDGDVIQQEEKGFV